MPIANSDYVPDPFPGIALPSGTGLPGSQGSRTPPPDDVQTEITSPAGTWWGRTKTRTNGTSEPGQNDDGWTGLPTKDLTESGAGQGHTDAWHRHSWQNPAGAS